MATELHFDCGTLVAPTLPEDARLQALFQRDARTGVYRTEAWRYREVVLRLRELKEPYEDRAKRFEPLSLELKVPIEPFPHQREALEAWTQAKGRGLVELPTGAGKTLLAVLAIAHVQRPTLVVVPTLDLMAQWQMVLSKHLGVEVGLLGGGVNDRRPVTVTTYDSATQQMEFHGNRFGLLICDECHHLPAPSYRFIAEGSLAPYRLGLSATLERTDGGERICRGARWARGCTGRRSRNSQGRYLAPYEVRRIEVQLPPEEKARYDEARARYVGFLRKNGISLSAPEGWASSSCGAQRSDEGRARLPRLPRAEAHRARRRAPSCDVLWRILVRAPRGSGAGVHGGQRDGVRVREAPPAAGHHAPHAGARAEDAAGGVRERRAAGAAHLEGAQRGRGRAGRTVGVILSGSGSVREHVQRLGRILRQRPGKRALLYEVCSAGTAESGISERRRQHHAYQEGP